MMLDTVATPDVAIRLETRLECECKYDESTTDRYRLSVEIKPDGETVELQSFAKWLTQLTDEPRSHEELAKSIYSNLQRTLPNAEIVVELSGNHYGIDTTVSV